MFEMAWQLPAHIPVNGDNSIEPKTIIDALFVTSSNQVEVGQHVAQSRQMNRRHRLHEQFDAIKMPAYGKAFALDVEIEPAAFTLERLRARKILFSEVKQKIQLLLDLNFAFDLIDLCEVFSPFGFDLIVGIDGAVLYAGEGNQFSEGKFIDNPDDVFFC
jgi:hypothetical protein